MKTTDAQVWMDVAKLIAQKSRCVRSQVGCVVVGTDGRVVATGYNGAPAGYRPARHRDDKFEKVKCNAFCPRAMPGGEGDASTDYGNCVACHAEANAIAYSSRHELDGATIYVTRMPCWECCKLIANSGITRVVAPRSVSEDNGRAMWTDDALAKYRDFLKDCNLMVILHG